MVTKLINEGTLVGLHPGQTTVARQVGIDLVRLGSKVGTNISGSHHQTNGILDGVEGGIVVEVGDAMQMQPALILWAVDLLTHRVHLWRLEVGPSTTLIKRNHRSHNRLILSSSSGRASLVNICLGGRLFQLFCLL